MENAVFNEGIYDFLEFSNLEPPLLKNRTTTLPPEPHLVNLHYNMILLINSSASWNFAPWTLKPNKVSL